MIKSVPVLPTSPIPTYAIFFICLPFVLHQPYSYQKDERVLPVNRQSNQIFSPSLTVTYYYYYYYY
jgi:hypothetical protein